eukprot:893399_1
MMENIDKKEWTQRQAHLSTWFRSLYHKHYIYIFPDPNDPFNNKISRYHLATDEFEEITAYPNSVSCERFRVALDAEHDMVYIIGGNEFITYNIDTNEFAMRPDFIQIGMSPAICYIHKYKQLHIMGGDQNKHLVYTIATNSLHSLDSPFDFSLNYCPYDAIVFCNQTNQIFVLVAQAVYYCEHTDNGIYTWIDNGFCVMPSANRPNTNSIIYKDRYIVIFGGVDDYDSTSDQIFYFDMHQHRWYESDVLCPANGTVSVVITDQNEIHLFEFMTYNGSGSHHTISASSIINTSTADTCFHQSFESIAPSIQIEDLEGFTIRSQFGRMNAETPALLISMRNDNIHKSNVTIFDMKFAPNYTGVLINPTNLPIVLSPNTGFTFYLPLIITEFASLIVRDFNRKVRDMEWFDCSALLMIETNVFNITTSLTIPLHLFLSCNDEHVDDQLWKSVEIAESVDMSVSNCKYDAIDLTNINMKLITKSKMSDYYFTTMFGSMLLVQITPGTLLSPARTIHVTSAQMDKFACTLCCWCIKQYVENDYIIHQKLRATLYDDPYHDYLSHKGFTHRTYHSSVPNNIWLFDFSKIYLNTDACVPTSTCPDFLISFNIVHYWTRTMPGLSYIEWGILEQIALYANNEIEYVIDFHEPLQKIGINVTYDFERILSTTSVFGKKYFVVGSSFVKMNQQLTKDKSTNTISSALKKVKSNPPSTITLRVNRNAFDIGCHFEIDIKLLSDKHVFPYYRFKRSTVMRIFRKIPMFEHVDIYHMSIIEDTTYGIVIVGFIPDKTDRSKEYFDSFNGYLLNSVLFECKMFIGLSELTSKDVSIECSHCQNGRRNQFLDGGFSDKLREKQYSFNRCTRLIWAKDEQNKDVWYLVVFNVTRNDPLLQFAVQLDQKIFPDLNDYGGIVYSGYGKDAPQKYKDLIQREFFIKGFKNPNVDEQMDVRYITNGVRQFQANRYSHDDW